MKLETFHDAEVKAKYKLVRTDDYSDVAGVIIGANEATGDCTVQVGEETKTLSFGPRGIRIIKRGRR